MAIYELRTYQVMVGKMTEVVALYKAEGYPALERLPARLVGAGRDLPLVGLGGQDRHFRFTTARQGQGRRQGRRQG